MEEYHNIANAIKKKLQRTCKDICSTSPFGIGWKKDGETRCHCHTEFTKIYPLIKAGIPMEYIEVDSISKESREPWKHFKKMIGNINETVEKGIGFCVWSPLYGVGKTTFTCEFLKIALKANIEGYYIHIKKFQDYVFMFHDKEQQSYNLTKIMNADVLVIDGLGEEYQQDKYKYFPKQLSNFIRIRRNENKSTTFSTNKCPDDLRARYGEEFFSLMKNRIKPFEIVQKKDLRGKKNGK